MTEGLGSSSDVSIDPDLKSSKEIHIAPLGYEYDRVIEPPKLLNADKVILLEYFRDEETGRGPGYYDEIVRELEDAGIEAEIREFDLFNLYDTIGTIARIINEYQNGGNTEVFVNLASGSTISAIGGMIACMAKDATPYYARAEDYAPDDENLASQGVREIMMLPAYPIEKPAPEPIAVLDYVKRKQDEKTITSGSGSYTPGVKKGEIIDFCDGSLDGGREMKLRIDGMEINEDSPLPFIANSNAKSNKGKYRLLDTHVIKPLENRGAIQVEKRGRSKEVKITENGVNLLRAFRYLIE